MIRRTVRMVSIGSFVMTALAAGFVSTVVQAAPPAAPAAAAPNPKAVDAIGWAISYCKTGFKENAASTDMASALEKYKQKRGEAVAADASITTWNGASKGNNVRDWVARCDKELPQKIAGDASSQNLTEVVGAAMRFCSANLQAPLTIEKRKAAFEDYKKQKEKAVAANGGSTTFKPINGQDPTAHFANCDKAFPKAIEDAVAGEKAQAAFVEKKLEEQAKEAERARAIAEEADRKLIAKLKGDRKTLYKREGMPNSTGGDDLERASSWSYYEDHSSGVHCTTIYRFSGDKQVSKQGPICK